MKRNSVRIQEMLLDCTFLENQIRYLSSHLFDLDVDSKRILGKIATQKKVNQYQLGMCLGGRSRRDTARRRILDLLKNGYVIAKTGKKTRAGTKEKQHELTLKGFLASSITTFTRDNYLMKEYEKYLYTFTDNRFRIVDLFTIYVKYHLVLTMLWYKMMGSKMTSQVDLVRIFSKSMIENILFGNYPLSELTSHERKLFYLIGQEFQILFHVIKKIITELSNDPILPSKINLIGLKQGPHNEMKKQLLTRIIEGWITDWALYIESDHKQSINSSNPRYVEYGEGIMMRKMVWDENKIKASTEYISSDLGLKSHHFENE